MEVLEDMALLGLDFKRHKIDAMSFRSRVHDALNITKRSVKLPIKEVLLGKQYVVSKSKNFHSDVSISGDTTKYDIGGGHSQTLDYLGFIMGDEVNPVTLTSAQDSGNLDDGPISTQRPYPTASDDSTGTDTGFHYLGGLYDENNELLTAMRKSAITPTAYETGDDNIDWPSQHLEQAQLLSSNPSADALIYHQTKLEFLITGILKPEFDQASNHRGLVRMLIVRPIIPSARLHMNGVNGKPIIRTDYLPNIDTELFYSGKKMLGGRMLNTRSHDANDSNNAVTFGLDKMDAELPVMNLDPDSIYYGKMAPSRTSAATEHRLSAFDLITAPINRKKFKVISDQTFHMDTQHHGVASMRTQHVTIPYHFEAKFAGRVPYQLGPNDTGYDANLVNSLTNDTFNEPLNMKSKPIILFLSMDQKLSVQPTGFTVISET